MRDILASLDDEHLFGNHFTGPSWRAWRVFLRALFGLPMDDASRALFAQCTGRATPPDKAFAEAVICVGRRGGKSQCLAIIAVFLACFRDYSKYLSPGEVATVIVLAANRNQARSIFRYISGLLHASPFFKQMIVDENTEAIALSNRVQIEIGTASFRVTRGYSYAAVLADEVAFFRSEESSANMDVEIMRALRPGMSTIPGSMLLMASSPYAKRGELYNAFRRYFGRDDARVLFWKADTTTMNPRVPADIISEAYESDPQAADAEYGANFRSDIADFISREAIDAVTMIGRSELPPLPGIEYRAFVDPSGGVSDSMALAVGHLQGGGTGILDALLEVRAPFDPAIAVEQCTALLRRYGVTRVVGDKFAGEWPKARFAECGISFEQSARPKSDLYLDFLSLVNSSRVELLDHKRLVSQLCSLERRTARSGRDSVDHAPNAHDDIANVCAGCLVGLDLERRPPLIRQSDMLVDRVGLPLPAFAKWIIAVLACDKFGSAAVIYAARMHDGTGPPLLLMDFDSEPMNLNLFRKIGDRVHELTQQCKAQGSVVFVYPAELLSHALAVGLTAQQVPDEVEPANLLLSASNHVSAGGVKICAPVLEKSRTVAFGAALDFRVAENTDDPLRQAAVLMIGLALDNPP